MRFAEVTALSLFVLAAATAHAELTDDLVGHWKLDETAPATIAVDSSIEGNAGTLYGDPEWYAGGWIRGALDFDGYDGSGDYVEIPNSPSLEDV